jgi:hypothetical protein
MTTAGLAREEPQQRDNLCGPFHAARLLREAGVSEWEGVPVDQDLVALHAGTALPEQPLGPQAPAGSASLAGYRYELPLVAGEAAGTTAGGLAQAIVSMSSHRLECVPLAGPWNVQALEALLARAPDIRARLIANIRTGPLWTSRPPIDALLAELRGAGDTGAVAGAEWDVGHFVELTDLVRGSGGALVLVRDSYPSLGWNGHHLQPARAVVAALQRGDGREGGVLAVVPAGGSGAVGELARELSLQTRMWDNLEPGGS